jgi:putative DNA primase/helicase
MNERLTRRLGLHERGYSPLPVGKGKKSPAVRGWSKLEGQINEAIIHSWEEQFPNAEGTGIILGHLIGIDIDVDQEAIVDDLIDLLAEQLDGDLVVRIGNAPRAMVFARTLTPMRKLKTPCFGTLLNQNQQVEILAQGQFAVTHHIHPETKQPYHWPGIDLLDVDLTSLPVVSESGIKKFLDNATEIFKRHGLVSGKQHREREKLALKNQRSKGHDELTTEMIHHMLDAYPNEDLDYDDWIVIGMALQAWGGSKAKELFESWSASSSKNIPEFTAQKFHDCADPHSITVGTLVYKAIQNGYRFPTKHSSAAAINEERPKARIFIHSGKLNESITAVEDAINQSNLDIFRFNGSVVEIVASEDNKSPNEGQKQILFHTRASLKDRLGVILECFRFSFKIKGWYRTNAPNDLLESLIERGALSSLPRLKKLADCLYLDEERVISKEGYNEQTQVFLAREICKPACLKAKPLLASAQASLLELREFFSTFPFKEEADEAVAIAALLALCDSINLDNIPLFGFNAPTAGTGKSLLVDVICGIASGKPAAVMSQGKDEAETEKRLHSAALRGDDLIAIDNCEAPLKGDTLCQILTQPTISIRPLGVSRLIDIEKQVIVIATGNNLEVQADLVRRTLLCTMDADCERPETRQFAKNPYKEALEQRDELVGHCLNIIRTFQKAGAPKQAHTLGSFETFSSRIRDALIWLGSADPVASQNALRTNDRTFEAQAMLIAWLWTNFEGTPFRVREVSDILRNNANGDAEDVMADAGVIRNGTFDNARMGRLLRKLEGKIISGLRLAREGTAQNATCWRISNTQPSRR